MSNDCNENATTVFVEDWLRCNNILGEGAYGEVQLLVHKHNGKKIACKIIDKNKYKDASKHINREVTIHSLLEHDNIIQYFGRRQEPNREYIFLEYAAHGELFQLIEPEIGMPVASVQIYMKQLLCGVRYLHDKGITHRDIKPENILISADRVLKIADFGLATLFRHKGRERLLDKKCGTRPYLAPEVLQRPYRAQPADIWSCGIVFVAMLTGELPWDDTTDGNSEFSKWKTNAYILDTPWSKLSTTALGLARNILNIDSNKRFLIVQIMDHLWMKFNFNTETRSDSVDTSLEHTAKRCNSMMGAEISKHRETPVVTLSQPVIPTDRHNTIMRALNNIKTSRNDLISFSQPTQNDNLVIQFTQSPITKDNFDSLIKRMTRFYVSINIEKALETLCSVLDSMHLTWKIDINGAMSISTWDSRKNQLVFKVNLLDMDGQVLIDFRLSKGCGLQFKKTFLNIKECVSNICH